MTNLAQNENKDTKMKNESRVNRRYAAMQECGTKQSCEGSKRRRECLYSNPRVGSDRQRRRAHTANRMSINRAYIRVPLYSEPFVLVTYHFPTCVVE